MICNFFFFFFGCSLWGKLGKTQPCFSSASQCFCHTYPKQASTPASSCIYDRWVFEWCADFVSLFQFLFFFWLWLSKPSAWAVIREICFQTKSKKCPGPIMAYASVTFWQACVWTTSLRFLISTDFSLHVWWLAGVTRASVWQKELVWSIFPASTDTPVRHSISVSSHHRSLSSHPLQLPCSSEWWGSSPSWPRYLINWGEFCVCVGFRAASFSVDSHSLISRSGNWIVFTDGLILHKGKLWLNEQTKAILQDWSVRAE